MMPSNVKPLPIRNMHASEQQATAHSISIVTIIASVVCVVAMYFISMWMIENLNRPLATVKVESDFQHLTEQEVESSLQPYTSVNFLAIDLDRIKNAVYALPWVSSVTVRRVWPDGLWIKIKEQIAVARWGDKQLLDETGRVFSPAQLQSDVLELPMLNGPEGYEKSVMEQYRYISQLLSPLNRRIVHLTLVARGAWELELDDGMKIMLGRDHLIEKIQRFIRLYQTELVQSTTPILVVDVRYNNGIAVQWGVTPEMKSIQTLIDVKS